MKQAFKLYKLQRLKLILLVSGLLSVVACSSSNDLETSQSNDNFAANSKVNSIDDSTVVETVPAKRFDLSHWKLTLPTDINSDGKVDGINNKNLQGFSHQTYFYLDELGHLVFTAPNKGGTTQNSFNTRSELRYMSRGIDSSIGTHDPLNNFAIQSHPNADKFASIGGKMEVTMHVDHSPRNSLRPNDRSSYAAVIGQVHAIKYKKPMIEGFGYGNEPLKIVYKKWPNHETGSIYWRYERNLEKGNPKRGEAYYQVWGNSSKDLLDPKEKGIALGEDFSYTVNVYKDTMYLTFENPRLGTVRHQINLADNIGVNGNVDANDNPKGYLGDGHYFKAGVYNQCRALPKKNETEGRCPGTGDWLIDYANGDYAQVSFSRLIVSDAESPK